MPVSLGGIPVFMPRSALTIVGRSFCLSYQDQKNYWNLLTDAFPDLVCYGEYRHFERQGKEPPPLPVCRDQLPAPGKYVWLNLVFERGWQPEWQQRHGAWDVVNDPYPNGVLERGGYVSAAESNFSITNEPVPERMRAGRIYFRCEKADKKHLSVARKCLRLLSKVAINSVVSVKFPSLEIVGGGGILWLGHDAARWCREDSRRFVDYNPYMRFGLRPAK